MPGGAEGSTGGGNEMLKGASIGFKRGPAVAQLGRWGWICHVAVMVSKQHRRRL